MNSILDLGNVSNIVVKNLKDGKRPVGNGPSGRSFWRPTLHDSSSPLHPRTSVSSHRTIAAALSVRTDPPHPTLCIIRSTPGHLALWPWILLKYLQRYSMDKNRTLSPAFIMGKSVVAPISLTILGDTFCLWKPNVYRKVFYKSLCFHQGI